MRRNNKKQKIVFDFSKCRYYSFDKRCTQLLNNSKALLCLVNGDIEEDFICRANTKKALLRQIRKRRFPRGTSILIDRRNFIFYYGDCDFWAYVKSDPN